MTLTNVTLLIIGSSGIGLLASIFIKRPRVSRAVAILSIGAGAGLWILLSSYLLHARGLAHTFSRHYAVVSAASDPVYGTASIVLHAAAGLFLLFGSVYFAVRAYRAGGDGA